MAPGANSGNTVRIGRCAVLAVPRAKAQCGGQAARGMAGAGHWFRAARHMLRWLNPGSQGVEIRLVRRPAVRCEESRVVPGEMAVECAARSKDGEAQDKDRPVLGTQQRLLVAGEK